MSTTTPETPQPQQPPQGALSGALSSLVAVGQYASRACAAARYDFATLFAHGASPAQRARAAGGLALTAVIVGVLGYAALQEWRIHIAYNPELAHQQLLKATADATTANTRSRPSLLAPPQEQPNPAPPPRTQTMPDEPQPDYVRAGLLLALAASYFASAVAWFTMFIPRSIPRSIREMPESMFFAAINADNPALRWSFRAAFAFGPLAFAVKWLLQ